MRLQPRPSAVIIVSSVMWSAMDSGLKVEIEKCSDFILSSFTGTSCNLIKNLTEIEKDGVNTNYFMKVSEVTLETIAVRETVLI